MGHYMYLKLAKKYSLYNKVLYTQCVRAHEHRVGAELGPKTEGVWGKYRQIGTEISRFTAM